MGLARDLTMGPGGGRRRRSPQPASAPVYRTVRRLVGTPDLSAEQIAELKAAIEEIGSTQGRLRPAEGRLYAAACTRYREATGETIGPETTYL
jgi:hypothetical protein